MAMQFDLIGEFFKAGGSRRLMFYYQEVSVSQYCLTEDYTLSA